MLYEDPAKLLMHSLRACSGTYMLVLKANQTHIIRIGCLGEMQLRPGYYLYVGSAFGPGGVRSRVAHHCKSSKRLHWHIDYLKAAVSLSAVWYCYDPIRREQDWAQKLGSMPGLSVPLPGFGATDRKGASHLFYLPVPLSMERFASKMYSVLVDHVPIETLRLAKPNVNAIL